MAQQQKKQRHEFVDVASPPSGGDTPLLRLPDEILLLIVGLIDVRDIVRLGCICRRLSAVCASEDTWKRHCEESFAISLEERSKPHWQTWRSRWVQCVAAPLTARPLEPPPLPLRDLDRHYQMPPIMVDGAVFALVGINIVKYEMNGPDSWSEVARAALLDDDNIGTKGFSATVLPVNGFLQVRHTLETHTMWLFDSSLNLKLRWQRSSPCVDIAPLGGRFAIWELGGNVLHWLRPDGQLGDADGRASIAMPVPGHFESFPAWFGGNRLAFFAEVGFGVSMCRSMHSARPGFVDLRVVRPETGELEQHWVPLPTAYLDGDGSMPADAGPTQVATGWECHLCSVAGDLLIVSATLDYRALDVYSLRFGTRSTVETQAVLPRRGGLTVLECNGLLHVGLTPESAREATATLPLFCFNRRADLLWSTLVAMPVGSYRARLLALPDGRIVIIHRIAPFGHDLHLRVIGW